jgi:hypothetical protein
MIHRKCRKIRRKMVQDHIKLRVSLRIFRCTQELMQNILAAADRKLMQALNLEQIFPST